MSVEPLKKITLAGRLERKEAVLARLQALGCVHILPLRAASVEPEKAATREAENAYKALRFLSPLEGRRKQLTRDQGFDVRAFIERVLDLKQTIREAADRRDALAARVETLRPWGELSLGGASVAGGVRFWFYELPAKERAALDALEAPWSVVATEPRTLYVVVLSETEPPEDLLPVARSHLGGEPLSVVEERLLEAEVALETLDAERLGLTRYLGLLRAHMSEEETKAELDFALEQTRDDDDLFVLQGWIPERALSVLDAVVEEETLALAVEAPQWSETPPTLLTQPPERAAGVDLAMFYQVPSYRDWDPTALLMASFAVFFAMIVADAGYGLVLMAGLLLAWRRFDASDKLRSWRRLGFFVAGATIVYGALVGSYFGAAPPEGSAPAALVVLDLNDFGTMMRLSILIGVAHLVFAIAMSAWVHRDRGSARARLGWIAAILGGATIWLSDQTGAFYGIGAALLAGGAVAVALFTSERPVQAPIDWLWRLVDGAQALGGAMGAFGDVLSYMRLFALGLASASLALTFNDLAGQVMESFPGVGLLLGLLILLVGHALNFALAVMSGVVHGLRLNYVEFFKWGLPEEGFAFRPLARKEVQE